ncbi:UvrD-helicase domain-containing protein [Algibacter pacificus]|uniref:UvrD-helicase domain-containing protein n=1 Tax=Algibacter pacificus TaxID=2599389 RepID=UPI0011CB90E7|nr:ATP-dependent helicase [Algibacter pacificus]
MKLDITDELQAYFDAKGKVVLNACPGSGKTTAIAQKVIHLEDAYKSTYGNHSGIACISFTNAAKDELNHTYNLLSGNTLQYPNLVSTIDSFINTFITLPFYYLLERNFARPQILENNARLDTFWKTKYKNRSGKLVDGLKNPMNSFKAKTGRSIYYQYLPSSIRLEPDGSYTVNGNAPSEDKVDLDVFEKYCKYIKGWQFEKGLITTNDSAFIALRLLRNNQKISKWLGQRFPHIIVDEAQDNSLMQHRIFEELNNQGLVNIEFIGDPYQSLYEFRDANPQLFLDKYEGDDYVSLDLSNNRRSPQRIIDCFSLLRSQDKRTIKTACETDLKEPILIYRYKADGRSDIISHFEEYCISKGFNKNKVVVRGNSIRNKMLGRDAQQRPWHNPLVYDLITAKIEYDDKNLKDAINIARNIVIRLENRGLSFVEFGHLRAELKTDYQLNARVIWFVEGLPELSNTVEEWSKLCPAYIKKALNLDYDLDFGLKKTSKYFAKATRTNPVSMHFNRVDIDKTSSLTTIHQVKGKTLDAILIFFDENNHASNINFRDLEPDEDGFIKEKKRIIYVAMSRPKHLLAIAFPEKITEAQIKEKLGSDILVVVVSDIEKK